MHKHFSCLKTRPFFFFLRTFCSLSICTMMLITKSFLWQFQINCRSKHWFPFPVQFRLAESEWIIEWFETINICLHFGTVKWRCFERSGGACEKGKKKKKPNGMTSAPLCRGFVRGASATPPCLRDHKATRLRACAHWSSRTTGAQALVSTHISVRRCPHGVARRFAQVFLICTSDVCTFLYPDSFQPQKCLSLLSASPSESRLLAGSCSGKRKPAESLLSLSSPANPAGTKLDPTRRSRLFLGPLRI